VNTRRPVRSRPGLELRDAAITDADRIHGWNNDPAVRGLSLDRRPIARDDHQRWMEARLADPGTRMWIVLVFDEPLGVVRIERAPAAKIGRVSIALDPSARGLGLGRAALLMAITADGGPLVAEVVAENRASRACFEACGFLSTGRIVSGGRAVLTYEWRHERDALAI
jgi:RimJ/RimL family protein N-acetyltransferase